MIITKYIMGTNMLHNIHVQWVVLLAVVVTCLVSVYVELNATIDENMQSLAECRNHYGRELGLLRQLLVEEGDKAAELTRERDQAIQAKH